MIRIKIAPPWSVSLNDGGWIDREVPNDYLTFVMRDDESKLKLLVPHGYKIIEYRRGAFRE